MIIENIAPAVEEPIIRWVVEGIEYADADEARDAVINPNGTVTRVTSANGEVAVDEIPAGEI